MVLRGPRAKVRTRLGASSQPAIGDSSRAVDRPLRPILRCSGGRELGCHKTPERPPTNAESVRPDETTRQDSVRSLVERPHLESQHGQIILPHLPQIRLHATPEGRESYLIRSLRVTEVFIHLTLSLGAGLERFLYARSERDERSGRVRGKREVDGSTGEC